MRRVASVVVSVCLSFGLQLAGAIPLLGPDCPSQILAFYYPWYGGPPDYRHWAAATDDARFAHDPKTIEDTGPGYPRGIRRDIASTNYPILGPYDSQSRNVVRTHLSWAAAAEIDVLISSWWGPGTYEDVSLGLLLDEIEKRASPVRASVYLETWALFHGHQFQPDFFSDPRNFAPEERAKIRQKAVEWIGYLVTTYGDRPGFARTVKGSSEVPVIFVYTAALFDPIEWQDIFDGVREATGKDVFYQGDIEGADFQAQGRVFDGLHLYTPVQLTLEGDLSLASRIFDPKSSVKNPASSLTDPVTVGSNYRAWATEARVLGRSWAATVIPGFDDREVRNPSFVVSRDHGNERTYDYFWREAVASRPDWVLITSFNEWHEGTEIEPSVEYRDEFLTRTRQWAELQSLC